MCVCLCIYIYARHIQLSLLLLSAVTASLALSVYYGELVEGLSVTLVVPVRH